MQHPWDNSTIFYQQVKEGGILPPSTSARFFLQNSAAGRQFAAPLLTFSSPVALLQQAGNPRCGYVCHNI